MIRQTVASKAEYTIESIFSKYMCMEKVELNNKILGSDYLSKEVLSSFALCLFAIFYNWNLI